MLAQVLLGSQFETQSNSAEAINRAFGEKLSARVVLWPDSVLFSQEPIDSARLAEFFTVNSSWQPSEWSLFSKFLRNDLANSTQVTHVL